MGLLDAIKKAAPRPAGVVTHENEIKTAEQALAVLAKEARKALHNTGMWNQEFQGNEIVGIIAIYLATRSELSKKQDALRVAVNFIGKMEESPAYGESAMSALESINQILIGETIEESLKRQMKHD